MISTAIFIDQLIEDTKICQNFAEKHWLSASPEALAWKDDFGWSINDVMQHLAAFATYYIPNIEAQLQWAQSNPSSPNPTFNFTPELIDFIKQLSYEGLGHMANMGHFEKIDVAVAPEYTATHLSFVNIQQQLRSLLATAKTVDIEALLIPSIIQENTDFKLGACFLFIVRHQILHFAQAERIMEAYNKKQVYSVNMAV